LFRKKNKKIEDYLEITFVARDELILNASKSPEPSKNFLPEWYKNIPIHHTKKPVFEESFGGNNSTLRNCMPFFDSWTTGYIMTTPCDVVVEKNFDGSGVTVSSSNFFDIVSMRGAPNKNTMPIPQDYYQAEFTWKTHWEAKTPEGYSCLYTHPINRPDLPFYTISGVMDTDKWYATGNHPFFIKKGFEGIIPLGTPMMTILPFKRDSWNSNSRAMDKLENDILQAKVRKHASAGYKKECWSRKDYI
jgi:hypothetical protein